MRITAAQDSRGGLPPHFHTTRSLQGDERTGRTEPASAANEGLASEETKSMEALCLHVISRWMPAKSPSLYLKQRQPGTLAPIAHSFFLEHTKRYTNILAQPFSHLLHQRNNFSNNTQAQNTPGRRTGTVNMILKALNCRTCPQNRGAAG